MTSQVHHIPDMIHWSMKITWGENLRKFSMKWKIVSFKVKRQKNENTKIYCWCKVNLNLTFTSSISIFLSTYLILCFKLQFKHQCIILSKEHSSVSCLHQSTLTIYATQRMTIYIVLIFCDRDAIFINM